MNSRIIIICLFTVIAVAIFGTNTLISNIHTQRIKLDQLKTDTQQAQKALDALGNIQTIMNNRQEDIKLMEVALPNDAAIPELLVMLEDMYQAEGFTPVSVTFGTSQSSIAEVPSSISGTSSYEQLFRVFDKIQSNIRPVQIKSFTASGSPDNQLSSSFNLSFPVNSSAKPANSAVSQ